MKATKLSKRGEKVIGWRILTLRIGDWPGGPAEILDLGTDPEAPEIVMNVRNDFGKEIGIFEDEDVLLLKALDPRKFEHEDCKNCHYLGHFKGHDLYYHHSDPETTFIARYGKDGDYYSSIYTALDHDNSKFPGGEAVCEALKRAASISTFRQQIFDKFKHWKYGESSGRWIKLNEIVNSVEVEE